jgi:hypothetical protein
MRRPVLFALLLLTACGGETGDRGPERPEPPELPTGEIVRSISVDDIRFDLYAGECPAIVATARGMQTHVERFCPGTEWVTNATETCGWFADEDRDAGYGCDVTMPRNIYGKVTTSDIGWVCVGQIPQEGPITSVRYLEIDEGGYILQPALPDESYHAHLFTPGGIQYGDPPLDAPSGTIYDLCELRAPWGESGPAHDLLLSVQLAESLQHGGVTVFLDAGAGPIGMSGSAIESDEPTVFATAAPASSPGLRVGIEIDRNQLTYTDSHAWPMEVLDLLASDCDDPIEIEVTMGGAVEAGHTEVMLGLVNNPCGLAGQ